MPSRLSPIGISVRTESGKTLGYVVDIEIDPDTHQIVTYHVKASRLVPDLVRSPLLVSPTQVISMSAEEMIVEDASAGQHAPVPQPS